MGFTRLAEYIAGHEVPRTLVPFAPIVSEAQSVVIPHGMILPSDVRNIYRNGLGSFRLPSGRPTAVRDGESCILLWDSASAQTGLKSERSFLMVGTVPEMFAEVGNSGIIAQQFRQIELAPRATSISLFWGTVASIKYRKRRRDNFDGACPLRGWHFRNFKTGVRITLEGPQSSLFLEGGRRYGRRPLRVPYSVARMLKDTNTESEYMRPEARMHMGRTPAHNEGRSRAQMLWP